MVFFDLPVSIDISLSDRSCIYRICIASLYFSGRSFIKRINVFPSILLEILSVWSVVVVTAGTKHNFKNTGIENLKVYTVYTPPNHIDGRIHKTKADANADTDDEAIGEMR